jgi:predicted TIM-barrel fold metal-dependent hydrolase
MPATGSYVSADFSIYTQPKVDCHCHVLDPKGFAYADDVRYRPAGQETGTAKYFKKVLDAYGAQHALLVGPNSGYGTDNRCLLDAIAGGGGRFKGIAVVPNDDSAPSTSPCMAWATTWRRAAVSCLCGADSPMRGCSCKCKPTSRNSPRSLHC